MITQSKHHEKMLAKIRAAAAARKQRLEADPYCEVPDELKQLPQWVVWKYVERGGKPTKPPFQPNGKFANSMDRDTWSTFDKVVAAKSAFEGIGFVFSADDTYAGIDLDQCFDDDECLYPWAEPVVEALQGLCYGEYSPSGKGLHFIVRGKLPKGIRNKVGMGDGKQAIEVYAVGRYFTVTGRCYGSNMTIGSDPIDFFAVLPDEFRVSQPAAPAAATNKVTTPGDRTVAQVLQKALSARNGHEVSQLMYGGHGITDASLADAKLGRHLAFYCGGDYELWVSCMRQSCLVRDKWDREDYMQRTWALVNRDNSTGGTIEYWTPPDDDEPEETKDKFAHMSSQELLAGDFRVDFLIEDILAQQQVGVISGRFKSQKTHIGAAAAVALATGVPFLNHFPVPAKKRVGFFCGEGGKGPLQRMARSLCQFYGLDYHSDDEILNGIQWYLRVPRISLGEHQLALIDEIQKHQLEVIFIDPAYLMLAGTGDQASNLIATGEVLDTLNDVMLKTGATPICLYHNKKNASFEVPDLNDMQYGGMPAFAGQWILLGQRAKYDPDRHHTKLWMNVGGRMGHGGLWGVNIDEHPSETGCARWEAQLLTSDEAQAEKKTERTTRQTENRACDVFNFRRAITAFLTLHDTDPISRSALAAEMRCGPQSRTFRDALDGLIQDGTIEQVQIPATQTGNHRMGEGYRVIKAAGTGERDDRT
jgi:hypothetical protein